MGYELSLPKRKTCCFIIYKSIYRLSCLYIKCYIIKYISVLNIKYDIKYYYDIILNIIEYYILLHTTYYILTLYGAVLHICNILFSTLLLPVVKPISLLCMFIVIFKLLLVRPHFLNYFFFIFAHVMVRDISLTQGSKKPRGKNLFCYDIALSHELVWYSLF